jgi:hypothetical protein
MLYLPRRKLRKPCRGSLVLRAISASLNSSEPSAPPLAGAEGAFVEEYPAVETWSAEDLRAGFSKDYDEPASWKENLIASVAALLQPAKLAFRSTAIVFQTAGQESALTVNLRTPRVNFLREEMYDDGNDVLASAGCQQKYGSDILRQNVNTWFR